MFNETTYVSTVDRGELAELETPALDAARDTETFMMVITDGEEFRHWEHYFSLDGHALLALVVEFRRDRQAVLDARILTSDGQEETVAIFDIERN